MSLQARGLSLEMDDALRGIVTLGWLEADGLNGEPLGDAFERERDQKCGVGDGRAHLRPSS